MTAAEIASALGGATRNGRGWLARCCCHEDRRPSLSLCDGDDKLLVKCFTGCDARDILDELRRRGLLASRRDAQPAPRRAPTPRSADQDARRVGYAQAIWREAVDPRGSLAERYLDGRGLALVDDLGMRVLRFHGDCPFGKDEAGNRLFVPALIVAFRPIRHDDETKPPQAIHRIGLDQDGRKLGKQMLGPVGGCAIKIDGDQDVEQGLGICEGLETGLAIRATGWRPVWCLGSAGAIAKFAPISGITAITIFADHDRNGTGSEAAKECAQAWRTAGAEAFVRTPRVVGADWLDAAS